MRKRGERRGRRGRRGRGRGRRRGRSVLFTHLIVCILWFVPYSRQSRDEWIRSASGSSRSCHSHVLSPHGHGIRERVLSSSGAALFNTSPSYIPIPLYSYPIPSLLPSDLSIALPSCLPPLLPLIPSPTINSLVFVPPSSFPSVCSSSFSLDVHCIT